MMFYSGKNIFKFVIGKKEHLEPWTIQGSQYYTKDRVREAHVTNHFFAKRNIGYDVLEWKSIFQFVLVKNEDLETWSIEGSQYYAKDRVGKPHITNPFLEKRNIGYDVLESEEHILICFSKKRIP